MYLIYVENLAYTIWMTMRVCNNSKSCVPVILPNFRPIHFDPNDEGNMFLRKDRRPPATLRRVTNQKPTISKITTMKT